MKSAQFKNQKQIILTASFVAITTVFSSLSSGVLAQSATNPFTPTTETTTEPALTNIQAPQVTAQDTIALTAIPPRLGDDGSLKAAPGERIQVQLRVRNVSSEPVSVFTSAQDFVIDTDGETPISIDASVSNRWSLASWLTIAPTEHNIAPNATVGINVLIEVPIDALPGGHYAMVLHQPGNAPDSQEATQPATNDSASAINQRVGTLLYVVVDGPINEEAYIRDFAFPEFSEYGPVPFEFAIENNSDIHVTPQMSVEIFNMFNQKIETIAIQPKNIFPLSSRDFDGQWDRVWGWGLYKARLTMSFGSAGAIVVANTSFWLLPVKVIIAAITLLLSVVLIALAVKRHLNHRKNMGEQRISELESKIQDMQQGDKENTL